MTPAEIASLRKRLGLTQPEMAALIGVSRPTIARAEADGGSAPPWLATIYRLIAAIGPRAGEVLAAREVSSDL